jgi:hypothetical protein
VLTCHCTVGVGLPVAAAVNVTFDPAVTVWLSGFVVTVGDEFTVSAAAVVVAEPALFVNTAWYLLPFMDAVTAVSASVDEVAPLMLANSPPLALTCHCTVGVGLPVAAAVNVALDPAVTVWLTGFVVTTGAELTEFTVNVAAVLVAELTELMNTAWYR